MPNLFRDQYPLFWSPNQDEINGDPRGLLRADNLTQEEDGVISLIRGTKKISTGPFPNNPWQLFSRTLNLTEISSGTAGYSDNARVRYVNLGNQVIRNWSPTNKSEIAFDLGITSGQAAGTPAGFGYGFGHIFILHGSDKKKDDGIRQTNLGLPEPGGFPAISVNAGPTLDCSPGGFTSWEMLENGSVFNTTATYFEIDIDTKLLMAIAMRGVTTAFSLDGMAMGGVANTGTPEDTFFMTVRIGDTTKFVKLIVAFMLADPTAPGYVPDTKDYYQFEWAGDSGFFNKGINTWSNVKCLRREFKRMGTNETLTWENIHGIKISFVCSAYTDQNFVVSEMRFKGGTNGPLSGQYTYVQVDVDNNGKFLEKSIGSASSEIAFTENSTVNVDPITVNSNANECWIYRIGVGLPRYYRVKIIKGAYGFDPASFIDNVTDEDALIENEPLDQFQTNLPDDIIGLEANWKGRNWYITRQAVYPSYRDNPSSYDSRWVLEIAAKNVETNLFITRLSTDTLILATTSDFYEITGTGGIINQGDIDFFDITVRPMGIKTPAIASCFTVYEGNLFYHANDGIRVLSGSQCSLLTSGIDLLFKGNVRYGIAPIVYPINYQQHCYLVVSKNRLYYGAVQSDNRRVVYVFDFENKNWRYETHGDVDSIMAMWAEEDGTIIYSTASFGDKFLRQLDVGTRFNEDATVNGLIPLWLKTIFDSNQQPRNRKDTFTWKLLIDTGAKDVVVTLRGWEGLTSAVSNEIKIISLTINTTGKTEIQFPVYAEIGLVKYYQLEITGSTDFFKLYNWSVDYESRPEQLSYLRVPPSTFGIAGRKRLQEIPLILDTLGNSISVNAVLDGVAQTPQNFTNNEKTLCTYFFTIDTTAFNVGLILSGGLFEFYELVSPREIEQLPDPVKYKWVPYTNFGTSKRKRFIQYALTIDTRGSDVTMTPVIDGVNQTSKTINTNRKQTFIYVFDYFAVGIDLACILSGGAQPFEFYDLNLQECITEQLPAVARYFHIPYTNFNTSARKRMWQLAFVIDTFGKNVSIIPSIDNTTYPIQTFSTNRKETVYYTFDDFAVGIDLGGRLEAEFPFEFYGINFEECVYEKLPPKATHMHIAYDNLGTTSRKKFIQYAFIIDTFGSIVTFTPKIDGQISGTPLQFATVRKETVIYTFPAGSNATGVDIGGLLENPLNHDFEFYGLSLDNSSYEKLPAKAKFMEISCTNYGSAARKRIRTIPFVIDTFGHDVTYTPKVDGVVYPISIHNTNGKRTVLHYFNDTGLGTPFGIDYCGTLSGVYDFEFYELVKPENVENLPVGKTFDQFGPIEFAKIGKVREISIRMVNTGSIFNYRIFAQDSAIFSGIMPTAPNLEKTYIVSCPKGINPNIFRMEISAPTVFHRFDASIKVNIDGAGTENKWVKIK